jgi:hypothetical protein
MNPEQQYFDKRSKVERGFPPKFLWFTLTPKLRRKDSTWSERNHLSAKELHPEETDVYSVSRLCNPVVPPHA